jgi:two-component system NtrC family sensor kinase
MDKDKNMMTAILDTIDEGIYIIDQSYTVEYMNRRMIEWFDAGVGKKCYEVLNNRSDICPWCRADEVHEGRHLEWELYVPKARKTFGLREMPIRNPDGSISKMSVYRDITERKQREARLKASEEHYRKLFEHVGVGVYISSKEGKFLDANQTLLEMLDYPSKRSFLDMDITRDLYVRPEDRRRFQDLIERDGRVMNYEVEFKKRDGTPVLVSLTSHVRYDSSGNVLGYEGIVVDQTERYQMERKLREAHDFMNKIIQSSPNPIMAADLKGNIIIWNKATEKTLGYPASEVIGKMNITRIYPEGVARKIMKLIRGPEGGGVGLLQSYPLLYVRQDGEVIDGNLSAAMVYDEKGQEIATVGSFVDLRERIDMEHRLRRTQEQLLHSEKLAAMGRLTSQLAHELNNPIYGIMNTLELLKTEITPENRRRKLLDMSLTETVRLADMLRKMLSFSKPEQEERSETDVNRILDELIMLHEKQLQEHDIHVTFSPAKDLPAINASPNQLRQVFLNLLANARDAMAEGGTLTISTEQKKDRIRITVADTGPGIKKEHMDKIFDSFFTTKDSIKGVGLGLSVCYGFIRDHGGDIEVQSPADGGAVFTVTLPLSPPEATST